MGLEELSKEKEEMVTGGKKEVEEHGLMAEREVD